MYYKNKGFTSHENPFFIYLSRSSKLKLRESIPSSNTILKSALFKASIFNISSFKNLPSSFLLGFKIYLRDFLS